MKSNSKELCRIEGTVAPGFESVRKLYEYNMRTGAEENTQLCVYHQGQKVVDLWASADPSSSFNADSLINIFSSGKSLEAIAIASLVGRGLLSYDAKISEYWPEFGANGKGNVTVAELMRHEAGLANFETPMVLDKLLTENIKQNKVGEIIENLSQKFRSTETKREYHSISRGWIANELFRRIEPTGQTIGEFLRDKISGPLAADVIVGVKEPEFSRVSSVSPLGFGFYFLESMKPNFLGRGVYHNIFQLLERIRKIILSTRKAAAGSAPPPLEGMKSVTFFNTPAVAIGESSSGNTHASARGLAKIAAAMSGGGKLNGTEVLNQAGWKGMHDRPVKAPMLMTGLVPTTFTQGGLALFQKCDPSSEKIERLFNDGREGFCGWMGLGGSIFQWHPEQDIGFAFVPTSLHLLDFINERGKTYQAEVMRCIAKKSPDNERAVFAAD
jgi:CubicO group peptidase (beta-lactamase class C family)